MDKTIPKQPKTCTACVCKHGKTALNVLNGEGDAEAAADLHGLEPRHDEEEGAEGRDARDGALVRVRRENLGKHGERFSSP